MEEGRKVKKYRQILSNYSSRIGVLETALADMCSRYAKTDDFRKRFVKGGADLSEIFDYRIEDHSLTIVLGHKELSPHRRVPAYTE